MKPTRARSRCVVRHAVSALQAFLIMVCTASALAVTNYVSLSGLHAPPYTNWFAAATNIQAAVDAADVGSVVLVSNGVYATGGALTPGGLLTNRVLVTKDVCVRSLAGPAHTVIAGQSVNGGCGTGAVRCVYIAAGTLEGFTVSNGFTAMAGSLASTAGGGVYFNSGGALSNCIIVASAARSYGGGAFISWTGALCHCVVQGNIAAGALTSVGGGGVYLYNGGLVQFCEVRGNSCRANPAGACSGGGLTLFGAGLVEQCEISGNMATGSTSSAGGVYLIYGGTVTCCKVRNNIAIGNNCNGGGASIVSAGLIEQCEISGNVVTGITCSAGGLTLNSGGRAERCVISANACAGMGGGVQVVNAGAIANCLITSNRTGGASGGGGVMLSQGGSVDNCTVSGNTSSNGGGVYAYNGGQVRNCIIHANATSNMTWSGAGQLFAYCCTTPTNGLPGGTGCITNNPGFVDAPGGDYRLGAPSPCIDKGTNMAWMADAKDLDGNPRVFGPAVDMGCYEFLPEPMTPALLALLLAVYHKRRRSMPSGLG